MQSFASTLQVQLNLNVSLVGIDKREPNCELMAVSLLFFIVYHYDRRLQRKLECVLRIIFVFMISQVLRTVWSLDSIWVFSKTSFFCLALQKLQFPTPSSVVENSADGQDGPTSCLPWSCHRHELSQQIFSLVHTISELFTIQWLIYSNLRRSATTLFVVPHCASVHSRFSDMIGEVALEQSQRQVVTVQRHHRVMQ